MFFLGFPAFDCDADCAAWLDAEATAQSIDRAKLINWVPVVAGYSRIEDFQARQAFVKGEVFGAITEGVGMYDSLNKGIGHYIGTQMPGEVGNFALAGHRTGWGAPLGDIANLRVGDSIYVETEAGWYRYVFRSLTYVMPTGVDVLNPVPQVDGATPLDRIITLTSCNPKLTAAERFIAYGVFDTWYPRAGGAPAEIASLVQAGA
jgi:sortase A